MPDRYPEQNPRAAWRVYEGEAVIVSPEDSMLHTLNAVGTFIWEAADGRTTLGTIVDRVVDAVDTRSIVLLHDGGGPRGETVDAVPRIIHKLRQRNYRFLTLSQYFKHGRRTGATSVTAAQGPAARPTEPANAYRP